MTTSVEIANASLAAIGAQSINDLSDSNDRARQCNLFYDPARNELLRRYAWPFAMKRASLAALDDENLTQFEYMYQVPTDSVRVLALLDSETYAPITPRRLESVPIMGEIPPFLGAVGPFYMVEGQYLYTDFSPCYIQYTYDIETVARFDDLFVEALIYYLASKIAMALTQNVSIEQNMQSKFREAFIYAQGAHGRETIPKSRTRSWTEIN